MTEEIQINERPKKSAMEKIVNGVVEVAGVVTFLAGGNLMINASAQGKYTNCAMGSAMFVSGIYSIFKAYK